MSGTFIIELKRGLKAHLPTSDTHIGQPYFCVDTNELFVWNGTEMAQVSGGTGTFASLAGGTNTTATMTMGSGSSLSASGSGVINATEINGTPINGTPTLGQIPIGQGDGTATFADPFVQGVCAPGTDVDAGGVGGAPINPVLIAGSDYWTNALHNLRVDGIGQIYIANFPKDQIVAINAPRNLLGTASVQSTSASATTLIAAGATGVWNDITEMILMSESATATIVSISDGTTTYIFPLAGNGALVKSFVSPLIQAVSGTAWTISNSAAVNVDCTIVYAAHTFQQPVFTNIS